MTDINARLDQLEREIVRLSDLNEIRMLPIMYCQHVRDLNIDAIVGQYAPDGSIEMIGIGDPGVFRGAALRSMMGDGLPDLRPWPLTHNHEVNFLDSDRATGRVHAEFRLGKQDYRATHIGLYEDEYVKLDGAWKFKSRKLTATPLP